MHDLHTKSEPRPGSVETLARYRSMFGLPADEVATQVALCFTEDARFETAALAEPLVGHRSIAKHIVAIGMELAGTTVRQHTEVQWTHTTARWCWGFSSTAGCGRGMDLARFATDDRIELLVVFQGLLPPPA